MKTNTHLQLSALVIAMTLITTACSSHKPSPRLTDNSPIASTAQTQPAEEKALAQTEAPQTSEQENPMLLVEEENLVYESELPTLAENLPAQEEETVLNKEEPTRPAKTEFQFGFNKNQLDDEHKKIIEQHGVFLAQHPSVKITINGHSDSQGDPTYNEHLSLLRAKHVAEIMQQQGANTDQIEIFSWGSNQPVPDANHHRDNRRVEIIYADEYYVDGQDVISENPTTALINTP